MARGGYLQEFGSADVIGMPVLMVKVPFGEF
jgi:hypothetical protein